MLFTGGTTNTDLRQEVCDYYADPLDVQEKAAGMLSQKYRAIYLKEARQTRHRSAERAVVAAAWPGKQMRYTRATWTSEAVFLQ